MVCCLLHTGLEAVLCIVMCSSIAQQQKVGSSLGKVVGYSVVGLTNMVEG